MPLDFSSLLMQVASNVTTAGTVQQSAVDSAVALVTAIGSLLATLGALAAGIAAFLKSRSHDPKITKALESVEDVGKLATAMGQKTVEQQKDLKTVAEVITTMSPQAKQLLEQHQKDVEYWKEKADISQQQLNRLLPMVPKDAQANNMDNLPRESTKTLSAN